MLDARGAADLCAPRCAKTNGRFRDALPRGKKPARPATARRGIRCRCRRLQECWRSRRVCEMAAKVGRRIGKIGWNEVIGKADAPPPCETLERLQDADKSD